MTDNTERDELAEVLDNAAPDDCPISFFFGTPTHHGKIFADAVLAAGFRRPRTIDTHEELDSLPDGTIIKDEADPLEKLSGKWHYGETIVEVELPAVVLWEPNVGGADD